jgi:anion-transporting  ArsA/GET3 family ATPase
VAVAIPEEMAVRETSRLLQRVESLRVACHWVVVNMIVPLGACSFCEVIHVQQESQLAELAGLAAGRADFRGLIPVPLYPHEIRTVDRLAEVAHSLYGANEAQS